LRFFGNAFGLALVEQEALERQGQDGGRVDLPEMRDVKQAIGEIL